MTTADPLLEPGRHGAAATGLLSLGAAVLAAGRLAWLFKAAAILRTGWQTPQALEVGQALCALGVQLLGMVAHGVGLALFGGSLLRKSVWGRFGLVPLLVGLLGSIGPLPLSGLLEEGSQAPVWLLAFGLGGG